MASVLSSQNKCQKAKADEFSQMPTSPVFCTSSLFSSHTPSFIYFFGVNCCPETQIFVWINQIDSNMSNNEC